MKTQLLGGPAFARLEAELAPGESIVAEADAMSSMDAGLDVKAVLRGGLFTALARGLLGGESFFVNVFTNPAQRPQLLRLVQRSPGDMRELALNGETVFLQPGAFVACTPGVSIGVQWAGLASLLGREGLFKLRASGTGTLWCGAYGAIVARDVDGELIVDSGHLVAYEPGIRLRVQLASGLFSSFFGGEGFVTRLEGRGKAWLQTRSLGGLASWLNPFLP